MVFVMLSLNYSECQWRKLFFFYVHLLFIAKCVDIALSSCTDVAYTQMVYPNFLDQKSREVIEYSSEYLLISVLHNLLQGECNPDLRLLGCSVLAPQCEKDKVIKPCRHVCENLKKSCLPAFDAIDMAWPYFLDCDRFFAGEEEGCFDPLAKLRGEEGNSAGTACLHGEGLISLSLTDLWHKTSSLTIAACCLCRDL